MFGAIVAAVASGFLIGAAARLALPGPDPMPFWLTVLIGLTGSIAGQAVAAGVFGPKHTFDTSGRIFVTLLLDIGAAVAVLAAYRHFVQRRPLAGPDARRFPTRGLGIARMRQRLHAMGVDPDRLTGAPAAPPQDHDEVVEELEKLRDLRDRGVLTPEEYEQARDRLRRY